MIMAVVALALVALFASISAITVHQSSQQLADDLSAAIDVASDAHRSPGAAQGMPLDVPPSDAQDAAAGGDSGFRPPEIGKAPKGRIQTPVAVYLVVSGTLQLASRSGAALDAEVLSHAAAQCIDAPDGEGALPAEGLVFLKRSVADTTYVAFADDAGAEALRSVLTVSLVVGVPALLFFLVVAIAFSRWATRPVQVAWDRQREFVTNASHELKTPLSIIRANTEVMLDEPGLAAADRTRWLSGTMEAAEDMQGLLDDMLALAGADEAAEGLLMPGSGGAGPVDVSRLVEGSALKFESRALEGGFALQARVEPGLFVGASEADLSRLVDILMDNACKYVDEGGSVSVALSSQQGRRGGGKAAFAVSNTGPGLSREQLSRVFDRFYRVDGAHASGKGHGLGLSLAKALSDGMGAGLYARSADGITEFGFSVPLVAPPSGLPSSQPGA